MLRGDTVHKYCVVYVALLKEQNGRKLNEVLIEG